MEIKLHCILNYHYILLYIALCVPYCLTIEARRTVRDRVASAWGDLPGTGNKGIAPPAVSPETKKSTPPKPTPRTANRGLGLPAVSPKLLELPVVINEPSWTSWTAMGPPAIVRHTVRLRSPAESTTKRTTSVTRQTRQSPLNPRPPLAPPAALPIFTVKIETPTPKVTTTPGTPPPSSLTTEPTKTKFPSVEPTMAPPSITKETTPPSPPPTSTKIPTPPSTLTKTQTPRISISMAPPAVSKGTEPPSEPPTANSNQGKLTATPGSERDVIYRICGYPIYCDREQCRGLNTTSDPLRKCETQGGAVIFGVVIVALGLLIVLGNCLLPIVVWKQPDMRNQYNYIKVSLAVSDMILGLMLLFSVLPNMIWTRDATESEIVNVIRFRGNNSTTSIISGSILVLTVQSSLFHLMFLSIERFIAIKWSFWHRLRKTSTVVWTICLLWFLSLFGAFLPAAFPQYYEYTYQPALLIEMMTMKPLPDGSLGYHGIVYSVITFGIPYLVLVVFSTLTGVVVYQKVKASKKQLGGGGGVSNITTLSGTQNGGPASPKTRVLPKTRKLRPEIAVFKTLILMIFAYSMTLLPVTVVFILFNVGHFTCHNYTAYFVVTYYFMTLNSFVNVIIYSARDKRFRTAVIETFSSFSRKKFVVHSNSKKTNSSLPSTSL